MKPYLPIITISAILSACSLDPLYTPATPAYPVYPPAVAQPQLPPSSQTPPPAPDTPLPVPPQAAPAPTPPAVIALVQQAQDDRRKGELERAATRLERALRIQAKNAELWYLLATIRLEQEQPGLAEELAKKSLSLAGNRSDLIQRDWKLIASTRRMRGDIGGAREAEQRALGPH